jgi:restriction endonuclease, S subunit
MTKMKESGIDWIGQIPEEWEVTKLKYALLINNGKDYKDIEVEEGGYPVIGSGGVFARSRNYMYDGDVVLLGRKGTIDKPLFYSGKFWTVDTMFYSTALNGNNIKFMYYSSMLIPFSYYSTATALPSMTQSNLNNHMLCLPSISEQQKIADFLDKKIAQLDKAKALLEEQIQKLRDYRASLIYETVTKGLDKTVPMKDSGIDWIGQVPQGWGVSKLKFILEKGSNSIKVGPFGSSLSGDAIRSSGKWVYNQRNVLDNNFTETDFYISEAKCKELKNFSVSSGDILLTTRGTIGRVAIVPKKYCEGIIHPCLMKFKVDSKIVLPELIKYLFNDIPLVREQLNFLSNSTTIDVIYSYNLKNIIIPTIPIEEQYSILEVLDRQTSDVDSLIKIKQKQIENINKQRQTLIYDYVTGKRRV